MDGTCSTDGCSRTIKCRGLCRNHYQNARYNGTIDQIAPVPLDSCAVCGAPLTSTDARRMYCSGRCNDRARQARRIAGRERVVVDCLACGTALDGIARVDAKFCPGRCGDDYRNRLRKEAFRAAEVLPPCTYCGVTVPATSVGRKRIFCSVTCKTKASRATKYGLSQHELRRMLDQHDVCAICSTDAWGSKGPAVDHDHTSGKVRGILCGPCNIALGLLKDDPARLRAAAEYLERAIVTAD